MISASEVTNCNNPDCPKEWGRLNRTNDCNVRSCPVCDNNVYWAVDERHGELLLEEKLIIARSVLKETPKYPYKTRPEFGKVICPECGSNEIKYYQYGLPENCNELPDNIILGGCVLGTDDPDYHCDSCDLTWIASKAP
ncbi:MAG: hypothetical protein HQL32_02655 [Planctomycetes bacterium]|nr:hypothetical protein [Planctomycetota bacterium]